MSRLTEQALDLDSHLQVLDGLLDRDLTSGVATLLDAAGRRAVTNAQKARLLYMRGRLAAKKDRPADAVAQYHAVIELHPTTHWAGRAAIALARADDRSGRSALARRQLLQLVEDERFDDRLRESARLELLLIESAHVSDAAAVSLIEPRLSAGPLRGPRVAAVLPCRLESD